MSIKEYEKFHCSIGFIQQAYYFFMSCLPCDKNNFPKEINGVYFESLEHVAVYKNELSYSFLLRVFGTLEELCNNLKLQGSGLVWRIIRLNSFKNAPNKT